VPPRTYTAAAMPAVQMLEILGKAELRAVINKTCATIVFPSVLWSVVRGPVVSFTFQHFSVSAFQLLPGPAFSV
jgi:hypothetical protein